MVAGIESSELGTEVFSAETYIAGVQDSIRRSASELSEEEYRDLLIFIVGEANAGKSSLVNSLIGQDLADVKAIPGWTKKADLYTYSDHLFIVDTPGLHESDTIALGDGVPAKASDEADIIMYVVNLGGNRTPQERDTFRQLQAFGRPIILVANKLDLIKADERQEVLDDVARRFGVSAATLCAVSAETGEAVEGLSVMIFQILEEHGGGLLWAKNARHRDALVRALVLGSAATAFGVGVVPIPFADIVPLTAIQTRMWMAIAKIYGYDISEETAKGLIITIAAGTVGRSIFRQAMKTVGAITTVGAVATSVAAGGIAAAMTYGLGVSAQEYYKSGNARTINHLASTYKSAFWSYRYRTP
jgi:GTPase